MGRKSALPEVLKRRDAVHRVWLHGRWNAATRAGLARRWGVTETQLRRDLNRARRDARRHRPKTVEMKVEKYLSELEDLKRSLREQVMHRPCNGTGCPDCYGTGEDPESGLSVQQVNALGRIIAQQVELEGLKSPHKVSVDVDARVSLQTADPAALVQAILGAEPVLRQLTGPGLVFEDEDDGAEVAEAVEVEAVTAAD